MASPYLKLRCGNKKCRRLLYADRDAIPQLPLGLLDSYLHLGGYSEKDRMVQCHCGHVTMYGASFDARGLQSTHEALASPAAP